MQLLLLFLASGQDQAPLRVADDGFYKPDPNPIKNGKYLGEGQVNGIQVQISTPNQEPIDVNLNGTPPSNAKPIEQPEVPKPTEPKPNEQSSDTQERPNTVPKNDTSPTTSENTNDTSTEETVEPGRRLVGSSTLLVASCSYLLSHFV